MLFFSHVFLTYFFWCRPLHVFFQCVPVQCVFFLFFSSYLFCLFPMFCFCSGLMFVFSCFVCSVFLCVFSSSFSFRVFCDVISRFFLILQVFLPVFYLYQRCKLQKRQCVLEHLPGCQSRIEVLTIPYVILCFAIFLVVSCYLATKNNCCHAPSSVPPAIALQLRRIAKNL